ncbi:hypothetical protein M406DRAFT_57381, partial [Cryphonectria parasitica EP155]
MKPGHVQAILSVFAGSHGVFFCLLVTTENLASHMTGQEPGLAVTPVSATSPEEASNTVNDPADEL